MFISRLEMSGFKSFASRTGIEFRPGVMSVVGPNGCGKTNIVDAVRWVLGEQRTGALRAERMEAVIFNGTAKRRPVGMAEVTLTVENDRGVLPSAYTQVEITRRLFRSGESEYLINRTPSRLRDIQDLFIDTGFGHSTYSIIELAMVEGIISGPSEARRALFEEAAGVAKFKARRSAAERRLESTKEALDRLKDVYGEVEKSYLALKRQSNRARRYQALNRSLQLRLLADLSRERLDIVSRRTPIEGRLSELEKELQELESGTTQLTAELLKLEAAEINLDGRIGRAMESLKRIERREAELDGELALVKQRLRQQELDSEAALSRRKELTSSRDTASKQSKDSTEEAIGLAAKLKELESQKQQLDSKASTYFETAAAARKELDELRRRESDLSGQLASRTEDAKRNKAERERLQSRLDTTNTRLKEAESNLVRLGSRKAEIKKAFEAGEAAKGTAKTAAASAIVRLENARKAFTETHGIAARAKAEFTGAEGLLKAHKSRGSQLSGIPGAIRKVLSEAEMSSIATRIKCKPEHRAAIAAAIKPILEAIDVADSKAAFDLADKLAKGEAVILRVGGSNHSAKRIIPTAPAELTSMASLITGKGEFEEFLRARLADAFLVVNAGLIWGLRAWAAEHGARLVTLKGEVLEPDGVYHAGQLDPEGYRVGWISTLDELEAAFIAAEKRSKDAGHALSNAEKELAAAEKEANSTRQALQKAEDEAASAARMLAGINGEIEQGNSRAVEARQELERLNVQFGQLPLEISDATEELAESKATLAKLTAKRKQLEGELNRLESEQRAFNESRSESAAAVARTSERLRQAESLRESAGRDAALASQRLAELEAKSAGYVDDARRTTQALENLAAQLDLVRREKDEVSKNLETLRTERNEAHQKKQTQNETLRKNQDAAKRDSEERNKLELEAVSGRERLKEVDRRLVEETGTQPESVVKETPERAEEELKGLESSDLSLEQIKVRIQSLGPVNMLALDELEQVEQRYKFLTDQRKDLEGGIEVLTEAIDRINHEARRRFRETFDAVDANFQGLFRTLFEGGEARITLEGGDPLESDIRIWATPSGKKLQGLGMLSGGEKALTAISLLFAIYMVRPSPFCILDEVDAPLDDSNVGRFNRMIRQFSKDTQFLVVTHNKRTMEAADSLFGVTLAEDGASQIVSVRLENIDMNAVQGQDAAAI